MDIYPFNNKVYKTKYICFDCRKVFKRREYSDIYTVNSDTEKIIEKEPKCPDCGNIVSFVGAKFRPPIKDDKQSWDVLKIIYDIIPDSHSGKSFGHLYTMNDKLDLPSSKTAMKKQLLEYKISLDQKIERLVRADYSERTKETIKFFSDKLKLLQAYLSKNSA